MAVLRRIGLLGLIACAWFANGTRLLLRTLCEPWKRLWTLLSPVCANYSLLDANCFMMAMLNAPLGKVWLRGVGQLKAPRSMGNGRKVGSVKLLELGTALLLMLT